MLTMMKEKIKVIKNKLIENKKTLITTISGIFVITIIAITCIILNSEKKQKYVEYDGENLKESKYPGYKMLLDEIKSEHPNWNITLLYTYLDWNEVIENEGHKDGVKNPLNLIPKSNKYPEAWKCPVCNGKVYDNGTWLCASNEAIKHQMDPRNFINEEDMFQFKELKFEENSQTKEGLRKIVENTFLDKESIIDAIIEAGKKANLDCYFIASRLIQEQGRKGTVLVRGYEYNEKIVYNPFNIKATGNSSKEILENAAKYAYDNEWFTLEDALINGIEFVKEGYINKGQNTLYLQKFDVIKNEKVKGKNKTNKEKGLYNNQYMQNLFAPISEASNMYEFYSDSNTVDKEASFIIPLYENMDDN